MPHPKAELIRKALAEAGWTIGRLARLAELNKQSVYNWIEKDTLPQDEGVFDRLLNLIPKPSKGEDLAHVAETKVSYAGDLDRPRWLVSYQPLQMRFAGVVPASSDWGDPLASEDMIEVDARYELSLIHISQRIAPLRSTLSTKSTSLKAHYRLTKKQKDEQELTASGLKLCEVFLEVGPGSVHGLRMLARDTDIRLLVVDRLARDHELNLCLLYTSRCV